MDAVHRLFTSLEFRTLLERLEDVGRGPKPAAELAELDLREASAEEVAPSSRTRGRKPFVSILRDDRSGAWPCPSAAAQAAYAALDGRDPGATAWRTGRPRSGRTTRRTRRRPSSLRTHGRRRAFDTMLAAHLLDPAATDFASSALRAVPGIRSVGRARGRRGRAVRPSRGGPSPPRPLRWPCWPRPWRSGSIAPGFAGSSMRWRCRSPPSSPACRPAA